MLVIAVVGYNKDQSMKDNTDVMDSLNLGVLTIIILVAAAATVATSFMGFVGAYFRNMLLLKLVRTTLPHRDEARRAAADAHSSLACVASSSLLQYVVLVLITFVTQIAIGAYMLNLDMSGLRTSWEQDDDVGYNRRVTLQTYLTCCG